MTFGVELRPDYHAVEGVHTGDQWTVDVDPENPSGVNRPVHWMGSCDVTSFQVYRMDLETMNLVSLGTGNVVQIYGNVVLATVDVGDGNLVLVTGNVRRPVGVESVG